MTRERWEDSMAVDTAWGAVERDPSRANVLALCEAVAACVDASPSETTGGEVYREALVRVMAHTGRTGADGHTPSLDLANGLLDSIARIAREALDSAPPAGDGTLEWAVRTIVDANTREAVNSEAYLHRLRRILTIFATGQDTPAGDGVPRVTEEDVAMVRGKLAAWENEGRSITFEPRNAQRILALLEVVSARKGGGNG